MGRLLKAMHPGHTAIETPDGISHTLPDALIDEMRDECAADDAIRIFPQLDEGQRRWLFGAVKHAARHTRIFHTLAIASLLEGGGTVERIEQVVGYLKSMLSITPDVPADCGVCGSMTLMIRGKNPGDDKRLICPTCAQEKLDEIFPLSTERTGSDAPRKEN